MKACGVIRLMVYILHKEYNKSPIVSGPYGNAGFISSSVGLSLSELTGFRAFVFRGLELMV